MADDRMAEWRRQRSERWNVEYRPSTNIAIVAEKSGWKFWAQSEMFFYFLGKGYECSIERSSSSSAGASSSGPPSLDLAIYREDWDTDDRVEESVLLMLNASEVDGDIEWFTERTVDDWAHAKPSEAAVKQ